MKRPHSETSDADGSEPATQPVPTPAVVESESKEILDRLYGPISLESLLVRVLDTPQYQRLAEIKQLGGSSYVYPSANHTRKEHSIGVAHLAGVAATHLRTSQPELRIDDEDILCVKLAGLVHEDDLRRGAVRERHVHEADVLRRGARLAAHLRGR